jgi:hypothetical protein
MQPYFDPTREMTSKKMEDDLKKMKKMEEDLKKNENGGQPNNFFEKQE